MKEHIMDDGNKPATCWQAIKYGLGINGYTASDATESSHLSMFSFMSLCALGVIILTILLGVVFSIWIPLLIVLAALIVIMVCLFIAELIDSWRNARNAIGERVKER